ncbi:hypothetical protein D9V32_14105 [Mycetocola tolaasinivorans]|uniref:HTH cro/C1-type domain-containing protein n=1 Tax=Mycetocola tolaasinivorans TaxID=76635 RepID=A0A3L7A0B4_9MICO|nr:helix-turn-helix transcriptional regulator [Mycetocola tolaasinivorans]RLP73659.1 hypothetical protein D9V32_14105 [Mycetocola tolaasinivorans]
MNYSNPSSAASQSIRAHIAVNRESIAALAEATLISESTIKRRLYGLSSWSIDELVLIAEHFSTTVSELLQPVVQSRKAG